MNELRMLEKKFGGWWCGVKFGGPASKGIRKAGQPIRFCEAVSISRITPYTLTPDLLLCPGGSRSFGWNHNDMDLAETMAKKNGMSVAAALETLQETPKLNRGIDLISIGAVDEPDIVISYAQPETVMKLLRVWQMQNHRPLTVQASGFMSVCGSVAVNSYISGRICVSFGCPDAREHGGISRDRLVVGMPMREVGELLRRMSAEKAAQEPAPIRAL